jgi:hypothetical protein
MMSRRIFVALALGIPLPSVNGRNAENGLAGEIKRVNHEGRILALSPQISHAVLFNTPAADSILASMQVLPVDSPWNRDIRQASVVKNSAQMIANIDASQALKFNRDMAFVIVPPNQKQVPVSIGLYVRESDPGPFPIPDNAPIEGWPMAGGSLAQVQEHGEGDRHVIVVDPGNNRLYEFGEVYKKMGHGALRWRLFLTLTRIDQGHDFGPVQTPPDCQFFRPLFDLMRLSVAWWNTL